MPAFTDRRRPLRAIPIERHRRDAPRPVALPPQAAERGDAGGVLALFLLEFCDRAEARAVRRAEAQRFGSGSESYFS